MKRFVSMLLAAAVAASSALPVFAADSEKMKTALAGVKTRIEIPAELNVFRSSSYENDNGIFYRFSWSNDEDSGSISVSSDSEGRIKNYNRYVEAPDNDEITLASLTRSEAQVMADEAVRKAAPELFADKNDSLVLDSFSGNANGKQKWFSALYKRVHDGAEVLENEASVSITAFGDTAYVDSIYINWDYDTSFSDDKAALETPEKSFLELFPIELGYERIGRYITPLSDSGIDEVKAVMKYSFHDGTGYISAVDGSRIEPYYDTDIMYSGGGAKSAMNEAAADMGGFTEEELSELDKVEGLISKEDAERYLRSLSGLKLTDSLTLKSSSVSRYTPWYLLGEKNTENEKFRMNLFFYDENLRNANAALDAQTGELISYWSYSYNDDEKKNTSGDEETDTNKFINTVAAEKAAECTEPEITDSDNYYSVSMTRLVNGIPFYDNSIQCGYDKEYSRISSYNIDWDDSTDGFAAAEDAIGLDAAVEKVFAYAPLQLVYVNDGESFRLCYGLSESAYLTELDAVTGEFINLPDENGSEGIHYSDIEGHWAQEAIERLAEVNMLENTDTFRPDENITQEELLRLLSNAFGFYADSRRDDFYTSLRRMGRISAGEQAPDSAVKREDAFVFLIRYMGFEQVAKLADIYKCSYADAGAISPDKIGYAAILTGLGVISGDAGTLRAADNLTRAEAAMMVFRYLNYKG